VTVTDLNDAQPGQVVNISVEPRGIDSDFRIAENRTRWLSETNELVVVAKKGADDDILLEQSRTLDRVSNRDADPSVQPDITTDTKPASSVTVNAKVTGAVTETVIAEGETLTVVDGSPQTFALVTDDGTFSIQTTAGSQSDSVATITANETAQSDVSRFTNVGRNRLRDSILAGTTLTDYDIAYSQTDDRPIRSDSEITGPTEVAEVFNFDVTTELIIEGGETVVVPAGEQQRNSRLLVNGELQVSGQDTVVDKPATSFDAEAPGTEDIRTLGLIEQATGDLIALARLDEPVALANEGQMLISFGPDDEPTTTFTQQGLEFLSQVIAGIDPSPPASYAYGSGETLPDTTDRALDDEVIDTNFDENVVQEADTDAQWESILDIGPADPQFVANGKLQNHEVTFTGEMSFITVQRSSPDFTEGTATGFGSQFVDVGDNGIFPFTTNYNIQNPVVLFRRTVFPDQPGESAVLPGIDIKLDNEVILSFASV
jgi:hypothetical protein